METKIRQLEESIRNLERQHVAATGQLYVLAGCIGELLAASPAGKQTLARAFPAIEGRVEKRDPTLPFAITDSLLDGMQQAYRQIRLAYKAAAGVDF